MAREDYEQESRQNYSTIENQVSNLESMQNSGNYRGFFSESRQVMDLFKNLKPLKKEDREKLFDRYINVKENVKQEFQSNASKLEQEIESLATSHFTGIGIPAISEYNYGEFWPHAKQISQKFKETSLFKGDRDRLWTRYRDICDRAKSKQEDRRAQSSTNRRTIEDLITNAHYQIGGSRSKEEFNVARDYQTRAMQRMKELNLMKEDRNACWELWKSTNEELRIKRQDIQNTDYSKAQGIANRCLSAANSLDPYDALQDIKNARGELSGCYMQKDQWGNINSTLNHAWNTAISKIEIIKSEKRAKHEDYLRRKEEKARKHEEWVERTESNISRWEGNIERAEGAISSIENNISKLEDMAANARTDDHSYRVQGWIEENYQKINDIKGNIRSWESKISDAQSRLRG